MYMNMKLVRRGVVGCLLAYVILFDLGAVYPYYGSWGRTKYSLLKAAHCKLIYPEKEYRRIGDYAWMTDVVNGYWCMSDADLQTFRASRG